MSSISPSDLFKRQVTLLEIGELGQQKLQEAKILVVGCGGLGSPIAVYLASSGIGKLHRITVVSSSPLLFSSWRQAIQVPEG